MLQLFSDKIYLFSTNISFATCLTFIVQDDEVGSGSFKHPDMEPLKVLNDTKSILDDQENHF